MALTNRLILALADSDECNPDDRGWGPKFSALKFARAVESAATEPLLQRTAELERQLEKWLDKTDWVQESAKAGEFGVHRADIITLRIAKLEQENKQLKKEVERLRVAHESTVSLYSLARKG